MYIFILLDYSYSSPICLCFARRKLYKMHKCLFCESQKKGQFQGRKKGQRESMNPFHCSTSFVLNINSGSGDCPLPCTSPRDDDVAKTYHFTHTGHRETQQRTYGQRIVVCAVQSYEFIDEPPDVSGQR